MKQLITSILLCGGILLAADFWQNKKPSEWTEKEARKIIENSPWVKEVQPGMDMAGMGKGRGGMGAESGGMGGGGMGGGGGAMGGPGGGPGGGGGRGGTGGGMGGPGGGGGAMQMPRVKVSFETAMPVAEAKARMKIQDTFKAVREEFVVISVSGMRMMGAMGGSAKGGSGQDRNKDMQERLLQMTTIKLQADKVYQPAEAKMQQTVNGPVILFAFPRKELMIGPDDKQLQFKTSMGPMIIEVKFNLKDMVYEKQLSL